MKNHLYIEGRRNGYEPEQCGKTMTVRELIEFLEGCDEEALVYLKNDGGYTYGSITETSFEDDFDFDEDGDSE